MSAKLIAKLRGDLATLKTDKIGPLLEQLEGGNALTDAEKAQLAAFEAEGDQLNTRLDELMEAETKRLARERRDIEFDQKTGASTAPEHGAAPPPGTGNIYTFERPQPGLGDQFVASPQFEAAKKRGGNSDEVTVNLALIKSVDANGKPLAGVTRVRDQSQPKVVTPLLDACGFEPVSGNSFEYIAWPGPIPEAGVVAEGMPKPEATDAPEVMPGVLEKLAHWIPITQEIYEDTPRLVRIIEGRLVNGVRRKAEKQGAATLVAASIPAEEGDSLLAGIRIGIARVQDNGFLPDTVVLNPFDYANIDLELLTKTLNGAKANSPLWSLDNIVPASAVPAGTAYVGDFEEGMTVYARSQVVVRMTDSHADYFINNKLVILAEQRVKTVVTQPLALAQVTGTVTP
jgi:Phage capsid family